MRYLTVCSLEGASTAMMTATRATPFVKWAGGKQALATDLIQHFPRTCRRLFEPFVGGGSVALALGYAGTVISDANRWLIDTYEAIRDDWEQVAAVLDTLVNTKEEYLRIRRIDPTSLDLPTRAAQFVYLNKTCFRGLYRVNQRGQFNVPYGAYRRRYYDPDNFSACAAILRSFAIRHGDFEAGLEGVARGDFVYLDPPYYKLGGYSDFNRYTRDQFREDDHVRLAAVCREIDKGGVYWALSNSDTGLVRRLFGGFHVVPLTARREINLASSKRDISELLITNYEPLGAVAPAATPTDESAAAG